MTTGGNGVTLDQRSLRELEDLARAYKAGDKALQKQIRKAFRDAGKAIAKDVLKEGAADMPARGGLRARLESSPASVSASLGGSNPTVRLTLGSSRKGALRAMDRTGTVRHPVFAPARGTVKRRARPSREWTWVTQRVPAHSFTDAFESHGPELRDKVRTALQKALDDIAKDAT